MQSRPFFQMPVVAWAACTVGVLGLRFVHAQPIVQRIEPLSVQVGQSSTVRLFGSGLDGDVRVWTSFSGEVSVTDQKADTLVCQLVVPAQVPPQIGTVVVWGPSGMSSPVRILLDDMAAGSESSDNHRRESAQVLNLPVAITGTLDGAESDFFAIELQAGDRVSVDVFTGRLGSGGDPILRLLGPTGRELAFADDAWNWGADVSLGFVAPGPGRYFLELRDSSYRSGLPYLLRVGDFPLVSSLFPMGIQRHTTATYSVLTTDLRIVPPLSVQAPQEAGILPLAVKLRADGPSGLAQLRVSDLAEYIESEPNNGPDVATRVPLPCALNGILQDVDDQDWFELAAVKGQRWLIRTTTRSWGSPAYPYIRVFDATGKQIAESPVGDSIEVAVPFTAPETGIYRLVVEELTQRFGPLFTYRLEIEERPFDVVLKPVKESRTNWVVPSHDGAIALDVQCRRFGYDGPIRLSWAGGNVTGEFYQELIPEKATEHRLYWRAGEELPQVETVRLVATADVKGTVWQTHVQTHPLATVQNPATAYSPPWNDGLFWILVTGSSSPILRWRAETTAGDVKVGGEAQLALPFERSDAEFKDAPTVVLGTVPPGIQLLPKVENDVVNVTIKVNEQVAAGDYAARLALFAAWKGRTQLAPVELTVRVAKP